MDVTELRFHLWILALGKGRWEILWHNSKSSFLVCGSLKLYQHLFCWSIKHSNWNTWIAVKSCPYMLNLCCEFRWRTPELFSTTLSIWPLIICSQCYLRQSFCQRFFQTSSALHPVDTWKQNLYSTEIMGITSRFKHTIVLQRDISRDESTWIMSISWPEVSV